MPSFLSTSTIASFAISIASSVAQQCYYPDGSPSTDIPCSNNAASSCCGSSSFCMDNGLCFGGGILSRGSCTDNSWDSRACTGYCKSDMPSSSIPLTPCNTDAGGSSTFVCGFNATACSSSTSVFSLSGNNSIVLRPSQVESLVGTAISNLTSCPSNSTSTAATGTYTSSQMTALGLGLGLPLILSLFFSLYFYNRERKTRPPKLSYPLPDDHDQFLFQAPPKLNGGRLNPGLSIQPPSSRGGSDVASIISSSASTPPAHMQSFAERYKMVGDKLGMVPRAVELPGSPMSHELGERRKSRNEQKKETKEDITALPKSRFNNAPTK